MEKEIIYYYRRGVASYLIAKKFRISNSQVRNILKKNNIKIRSHNVTNQMSADRRTPEENKKITKKASESNLGSIHSPSHRFNLAKSREKHPTIDPVYEQPLVDLCKRSNIEIIPQKAFGKFNVDLYLKRQNVVIEIFGGGFHNKKEAVDMFNNKIKYLQAQKTPVLVVWADKLTYNPSAVLEATQGLKNGLKIITGEGKPSIRGLKDINV